MTSKKIPLVDYSSGTRKVIGEAVIETDGVYFDISGTITDPDYRLPGIDFSGLSIGKGEAMPIRKEPRVKQKKSKKTGSS